MLKRGLSRVMKDPIGSIIKTKVHSSVAIDQLNSCEFFPLIEDVYVVKMGFHSKLYLKGIVKVSSINCLLKINGRTVKPGDSLDIYNIVGCSAIFIETGSSNLVSPCVDLQNGKSDPSLLMVLDDIIAKYNKEYNLFLLTSVYDRHRHVHEALKKYGISYFPDLNKAKGLPVFPNAEKDLNCLFDYKLGTRIDRKLIIDDSWDQILHNENPDENFQERIMICGGQGFGKSSLLRYLINRTQQKNITPVLIDFDPGQPETYLPGCISYSIISDPLMGPSYTHLHKPRWSTYVGEVDVSQNVTNYLEAVLRLSDVVLQDLDLKSKKYLFLINTMGYSRGIGVVFQCAIVRAIMPTKLVILESQIDPLKRLNFSQPLINNAFASEVLDSVNFPNHKFDCKIIKLRAPIDYVYRNKLYPENILSEKQLRIARQVCYLLKANKLFSLSLLRSDEWNEKCKYYNTGDIIVLGPKISACNQFVEFGEIVSYNDSMLTIRAPEYMEKYFDEYKVVILDVICRQNPAKVWKSMDIDENVHQANALFSMDL